MTTTKERVRLDDLAKPVLDAEPGRLSLELNKAVDYIASLSQGKLDEVAGNIVLLYAAIGNLDKRIRAIEGKWNRT